MNKKYLFILLILIIILFFIGVLSYPIFYENKNNTIENTSVYNNTSESIKQIDALSNLSFFKILVEDTSSIEGSMYSEKIVTIRDTDTVNELQQILNSAKIYATDEARGYDTPTTAICYLDDDSMCSFFVIDSNMIVFSDVENNKTVYKLDDQYDIEKFLDSLYNVNVNAYKYSIFSKNGLYGIKYSQKNIIDAKYDNIVIINPNVDVFAVTLNGVTTFIDKYEENPFPNFDNVELISATGGGESLWYENAIKFKSDNKYGLATLDGSILTSTEYDKIEALNYVKNYLILSQNGKEQLIKLSPYGFEEITGEFDSIKILGANLNFTSKDEKYLNSKSTVVVGINNNNREQYFEISEN